MAPGPVDLNARARPIRMVGLPARIRVAGPDPGRPFVLSFTVEPYDVPDSGGDVIPFSLPDPPSRKQ